MLASKHPSISDCQLPARTSGGPCLQLSVSSSRASIARNAAAAAAAAAVDAAAHELQDPQLAPVAAPISSLEASSMTQRVRDMWTSAFPREDIGSSPTSTQHLPQTSSLTMTEELAVEMRASAQEAAALGLDEPVIEVPTQEADPELDDSSSEEVWYLPEGIHPGA